MPLSFPDDEAAKLALFRTNGLDIMGVVTKEEIGVACREMVVRQVEGSRWDRVTAEEIISETPSAQFGPGADAVNVITTSPGRKVTMFFRTREGGHGILQILGQSENPLGVKIRYKLVQTTNSKTALAPSPAPVVVQLGINFGPVIERMIATPDADDQGLVFFDMETGKSFKPPFPLTFHPNQGPAFVELTLELKQWIKARDVDVLLHLGEKTWDLMTLEMQEDFGGQLNEWETISPEKVIGIFAKKDAEHLVRDEVAASSVEHNYPDEGSFNAMWPPSASSGLKMPFKAFRTRSNTMGVYQLQGMGNSNRRGVGIRYKLVLEAGESVQSTGGEARSITPLTVSGFGLAIEQGGRLSLSGPPFGGPRSRTFVLRHRLASEMGNDLGKILLGRVGMEAKPAPDNMQLTVTAPSDVLNRVSTFVAVTDWPKRIAQGKDYCYPREDAEQAGRSFFYACSIEDVEGVTRMLAPRVLAELKGTNLTAQGVGGEEKDEELVRQLHGKWEGKEAAVRRVVQAWNRFPLRTLQVEGKFSRSPGPRYYASAAFKGAPVEWVELSFVPDRSPKTKREPHFGPVGPLLMDTLPPWFADRENKPVELPAARLGQ